LEKVRLQRQAPQPVPSLVLFFTDETDGGKDAGVSAATLLVALTLSVRLPSVSVTLRGGVIFPKPISMLKKVSTESPTKIPANFKNLSMCLGI